MEIAERPTSNVEHPTSKLEEVVIRSDGSLELTEAGLASVAANPMSREAAEAWIKKHLRAFPASVEPGSPVELVRRYFQCCREGSVKSWEEFRGKFLASVTEEAFQEGHAFLIEFVIPLLETIRRGADLQPSHKMAVIGLGDSSFLMEGLEYVESAEGLGGHAVPMVEAPAAAEQGSRLVRVLERRIAARTADYAAGNAAWKANRESWSQLDGGAMADRAAWKRCLAESSRLNARCEALHKQIHQLNRALWRAEREAEERTSNIERPTSNIEVEDKISPPGRAAGADAGCPDEVAFTPLEKGEGGLRQRSDGNRVGHFEHRTSNVERRTSKVEEGRADA